MPPTCKSCKMERCICDGIAIEKPPRGFAAMDPAKQREIARLGGLAQGKANNPHNFANNIERARICGRKGGQAKKPRKVNPLGDTTKARVEQ